MIPADGPTGPDTCATLAVRCTDLVVRYGSRTAVDRVSFDAQRGEVLCILGPNGAGKTSTVECLEGYRRPAAGSVRVLGLDPVADHGALVGRIGVMLQRGGLYPMLGPRRALRLFSSYYPHAEDPEALLDLVRLAHVARTPWRHLSGGEQARLSLALALVGRPEVVMLDEPTAGVDPEGRLAVRDVIGSLRDRGTCVLLTTHELSEAERVADRVLMLAGGALVAQGTPASLMGEPATAREVAFGAPPGLDLAELRLEMGADATVTEVEPGRYRVEVGISPAAPSGGPADERSPATLAAGVATWLAGRGVAFSDLRIGRSLEEAYLEVLRVHGDAQSDVGGTP
ncbi:MAG TPA: ABC transporter ATP-binding protein [Acidimicrobiales bacterium]|nr:ABC transporter ATP-binding protein [Acidimicrobiales bacterium]